MLVTNLTHITSESEFKETLGKNENVMIEVTDLLQTSVQGVFAAGDAVQKRYRQVTTAVADGTIAALGAIEYLRTSGARQLAPTGRYTFHNERDDK